MWLSNTAPSDRRLIVTESAINAISHAVLFNDPNARYGSIGGRPTALQLEIVRRVIVGMPEGAEIVAAMDADRPGRELADLLEAVFVRCERKDLVFRREEPVGVNDWNDLLRARKPRSVSVVQPATPHAS
jgi:predicted nuclease with TOPRIM domain